MVKKDNHTKLLDQIKIIADNANMGIRETLADQNLDVCDKDPQYGSHTILKLAYLHYYIGIFLPIALKHSSNVVFVDTFGGSGLVRIKDSNYAVLGSALLTAKPVTSNKFHIGVNKYNFNKIITMDIDKDRVELLNHRFKALGIKNAEALYGDSNDIIGTLESKYGINNNSMVLMFIDPEGMEPNLSNYKKFYSDVRRIDTIMNFTNGIDRVLAKIKNNPNTESAKKLADTLKNIIPSFEDGDEPNKKFDEYFEKVFGKPMGSEVKIYRIGKSTSYSLILRVNDTKSHAPWKDGIADIEKQISQLDDKSCLDLLRQASGQMHL